MYKPAMKHGVYGRKLSRTKNERKRLFEGLVREVVLHGTVTTTLAKAKAVQPMMEKLITMAKKNTGASVNSLRKVLRDRDVYTRFMADSKRFGDRKSGFTRIVKMGPRQGDAAEMVRFGYVEMTAAAPVEEKKSVKPEARAAGKEKSVKAKPVKRTRTAK